MLDPNMTINIDNNVDNEVDDEITPLVYEFRDIPRSTFVVSHVWPLSHRCFLGGFDLEVGEISSSKNKLVNVVK